MPKPPEVNVRFESWSALAKTLLACGHPWDGWETRMAFDPPKMVQRRPDPTSFLNPWVPGAAEN